MSGNTRFEFLARFAKAGFQAVFVNFFSVTLVVVGLGISLLPVLFHVESTPGENASWLIRTLGHLGEAMLVAGVVTTFMRFFASFDIVGEKIQGWLTDERYLQKVALKTVEQLDMKVPGWLTDERYLKQIANQSALALYDPQRVLNIADLRTVWVNISLAMTRHAFPQIASQVYKKTLDALLKASEEYYIDYYSRETTITTLPGDADVVKVEHKLSLTVIANQHNSSTKFSARFQLDRFSDRKVEMVYFRADGVSRPIELRQYDGDRAGVEEFLLETDIPSGAPLRIEFCYRLKQSLVNDPFILWTTTRYVRYARHEINFPAGVECAYQDATIVALLEPDPLTPVTTTPGTGGKLVYMSKVGGELIFPGSAFIFMLRRESLSS